ncbi:acyltransferase family protein [Mucilaginibacter auburnensis]|uniref:Putative acyltransferase n=1 Tax=Mucilaginibacter auburnensis TaxID=1457233 RepID=A0A2H9VPN3_9SPHI|nr:heparan-alpha-glucosaminide N-acetyltransferase domain-containing protein [Mucilaginibacter auburnensis]PJJ80303.1 putative acyltransferase [Mucilaginibacter auburnensis]
MPVATKTRLLSLDVFRGATVAAMILVNNPGDWGHIYEPLEHSAWNGCTPTDLIFPFFLFIVGVSVVYAMESKAEVKTNHSKMLWSALRRMVILIAISLITQLLFHPGFAHLRFPGVLQRIGVVYFIGTVLFIKTSQRTRDVLFAVLLTGYYIVMVWIPVPDTGKPSLDPETNMGAWVDRVVFSTNHLWSESKTWDPEGLLGTLPAIATCLFGIRVGSWLKRKDRDDAVKVSWLFTYGIVAIIVGLVWGLFFPINKALWTSSFVLYTGGWATVTLALCYWVIDVHGHKNIATFFVPLGVNAITAYVLSSYIPHYITNKPYFGGKSLYKVLFEPYFQLYVGSALSGLLLVFIIWGLMYILYRRKIVIKV